MKLTKERGKKGETRCTLRRRVHHLEVLGMRCREFSRKYNKWINGEISSKTH